jgi:tRNA (guanine10-N2)-methyltransferase
MVAYELSNILSDLVYFASEYLVLGGRLVFWMPTLNEQYKIIDSDTKKRTFQL